MKQMFKCLGVHIGLLVNVNIEENCVHNIIAIDFVFFTFSRIPFHESVHLFPKYNI